MQAVLVLLVFSPLSAAQSSDSLSTRTLLNVLSQKIDENNVAIDQLRGDGSSRDESLGESASLGNNNGILRLQIGLPQNGLVTFLDSNDQPGVALTGALIPAYARLVKLAPAYEQALAHYRHQVGLYEQLIQEYDGVIKLKDAKVVLYQEMANAYEKRGESYKKLVEIEAEKPWEAFFRRLAFPAGLSVGIVAGVLVARNF